MEAVKWGWVNMLAIEEHDMGSASVSLQKSKGWTGEKRRFEKLMNISYVYASICDIL